MSIEAYKVAVKISLLENVTAGLAAMSRHFIATNRSAEELQKRLSTIGKMTLLGGGALAAGGLGLKLLEKPLEKAIEYERQLATLRQQGLGDKQLQEAQKFADAQKIMGQSRLDMIRHFTEAQGAFRESGMDGEHALYAAKIMTPVLGRYESASEMLSGHSKAAAHQAMQNLNKTVEIMGGITDPKRAAEIADGIFKAVQSSGRMIDERQLKQFVAYGSSATNSMDMRAIFGGLEPIIGEFGGSTVGTGLRTAFTRMSGAMSLPPKKMQGILSELGIGVADHGGVRLNDQLLSLMQRDAAGFAKKMLQVYEQHGISSVLDRERVNAQLFGTNGAKIYNKIMSQMPTIDGSLAAYDKALNPTQMLNTPEGKRLTTLQDYHKKVEDLQLTLGQSGGVLDLLIKGLNFLNPLLASTASWLKEHSTLTKILVGSFAALSGLAVVAGGILLVVAAFKALVVVWQFTRLGAVFSGLMSGIGTGLRLAGQAVLFLGRALLMNPVGLIVTGIAVAAFLLWKNWDSIKPKLLELWESIKTGFHTFIHMYLSGWQSLFNFLIEGINKLLPKAMELNRLTFADDYAKANLPQKSGSPYIKPGTERPMQVTVVSQLDGREVARSTTMYQAREANRPGMGAPTFDPTMGARPVGLGYAR
ncbi:hypothetical protein [Pandoraea sp. CB10b_02]|uniref:phage tail tape measure protein n=1 Tax=Pandoraea sp. CB10b_02 TaxID=2014535 RepID=UPI00257D6255|nr:hypothetical protein [Pandoraea sp. CB10b_02]